MLQASVGAFLCRRGVCLAARVSTRGARDPDQKEVDALIASFDKPAYDLEGYCRFQMSAVQGTLSFGRDLLGVPLFLTFGREESALSASLPSPTTTNGAHTLGCASADEPFSNNSRME